MELVPHHWLLTCDRNIFVLDLHGLRSILLNPFTHDFLACVFDSLGIDLRIFVVGQLER